MIGTFCQNLIVGVSAMMLTCAAPATGRVLVDDVMLRADVILGYDWKAYLSFVADHELLAGAVRRKHPP
jgi:hypothetical protein